MKHKRLRRITGSAILAAAYLSLASQWLWVFILAIPPLIKNGAFDSLTISSDSPAITPVHIELSKDPTIATVAVVALTAVLVLATMIAMWRIPKAIVTGADELIQKSTKAVIPAITHHRNITQKKRVVLSRRIRLVIQLGLSALPLIICLFLPAVETMTPQLIVLVAAGFAVSSTVGFVAAWLVTPGDAPATSRTQLPASRG